MEEQHDAFVALLDTVDWTTDAGPEAVLCEMRRHLATTTTLVNGAKWREAFASAASRFAPPHTLSAVDQRVLELANPMPLHVMAAYHDMPGLAAHIVAEHDFEPHGNSLTWWAIGVLPAASLVALVRGVQDRCGVRYNPDAGIWDGAVRELLDRRRFTAKIAVACITALLDAGAAPVWSCPVRGWFSNGLYVSMEVTAKSVINLLHVFAAAGVVVAPETAAAWTGALRLWQRKRGVWLRSCRFNATRVGGDLTAETAVLIPVLGDWRLCLPPDGDDMPYRVVSELAMLVALFL